MYARHADRADLPEVLEYCRQFWQTTRFHRAIPFDTHTVFQSLEAMLDARMLFVAERDMELAGMIGGVVAPSMTNASKLVGAELFFWVRPEYRKSGAGALMIAAIEAQARRMGCAVWSMIALDGMDAERVGAMYERAGYGRMEWSYAKFF